MDKPTVIDLFAGAGGATEGLRQAGFRVLAAIENDPIAIQTYAANHPDVHLEATRIQDVDATHLRAEVLRLQKGELTLLKACPPCQGFSSLGRSGDDDPRNDLVDETIRFVTEFEPQSVLVENVPGLRHDHRFAGLIDALQTDGYRVGSYLVDASDFGVPQRRRRLILVAIRKVDSHPLPNALIDLLPDDFDVTPPTAGDVLATVGPIGGSDPVHRARRPKAATLSRIQSIPVGGSRFDLPPDKQLACHTALSTRSATAAYGRIRADDLAPTMTTRCTTPACGRFIHPTKDRGISLREAALFQTFPSSYEFIGGYDTIERQIGNAVPVRMARALGLIVRRLL